MHVLKNRFEFYRKEINLTRKKNFNNFYLFLIFIRRFFHWHLNMYTLKLITDDEGDGFKKKSSVARDVKSQNYKL